MNIKQFNCIPEKLYSSKITPEQAINLLQSEFQQYGIQPAYIHFIDINKMAVDDVTTRKELWNKFRYLINYKDIS